MNAKEEIENQVRDLLAYFPGRGRLALIWLAILPLIGPLLFYRRVPSAGAMPYLFAFPGISVLWFYVPTMLVLLFRINHSDRSSWLESAGIIASSVVYGIIIGLPCLIISIAWSACYVGMSFLSNLEILLGAIEVVGAMLLLATVLGAVAHYAGFFIALLLFLMRTAYVYFLPLAYSITAMPEKYRTIEAATPLAPAIVILRIGILNRHTSEIVPPLYWAVATIHAALGYALAFWVWRSVSDPSFAARPRSTIGLQASRLPTRAGVAIGSMGRTGFMGRALRLCLRALRQAVGGGYGRE